MSYNSHFNLSGSWAATGIHQHVVIVTFHDSDQRTSLSVVGDGLEAPDGSILATVAVSTVQGKKIEWETCSQRKMKSAYRWGLSSKSVHQPLEKLHGY